VNGIAFMVFYFLYGSTKVANFLFKTVITCFCFYCKCFLRGRIIIGITSLIKLVERIKCSHLIFPFLISLLGIPNTNY